MRKHPTVSAVGSLTDFNVWDVELSSEEMINLTLCGAEMKGSLLPWNSEDWAFTEDIGEDEYSVEDVDYNSLCSPKQRLTIFPERITAQEAFDLCEVFGGTMVITKQKSDYIEVTTGTIYIYKVDFVVASLYHPNHTHII